jgi:RNA polymerase sigma-70 factor (ECF subfamily)
MKAMMMMYPLIVPLIGPAAMKRISRSDSALDEQDRGAWDAALVAEGHRLVRERLAIGVAPGRYQILAAINAVHTSARDVRDTDWWQVVALYDQLVRLEPRRSSPSTGPSRSPRLTARRWHWRPSTVSRSSWPAITPTIRPAPSCCAGSAAVRDRAAYDKAIELAGKTAETAYLTRRRGYWKGPAKRGLLFSLLMRLKERTRDYLHGLGGSPTVLLR